MTAVTAGKIIGRGDIVMGADETAQGRSDKVGKPAADTIPGARNAVAGAVFRTADDKSAADLAADGAACQQKQGSLTGGRDSVLKAAYPAACSPADEQHRSSIGQQD
ncbi:hypothetical protein CLOSYM_00581 [[Clostridium] symbiosum ATCC 14940]|uniref:Uncharacterized protein n=1 Tax=[Clostridium] symbiosum ATCC 14940 TaxID=411472 RepID=A0ABC9U2S8_CLOSY|nr:hypothetical protein CLOSYM_00581 [[Clostridium] symbiosum ATCC 14940]